MDTMARLKPIKDEGAVAFSLLHELVKEDLKARVEADLEDPKHSDEDAEVASPKKCAKSKGDSA